MSELRKLGILTFAVPVLLGVSLLVQRHAKYGPASNLKGFALAVRLDEDRGAVERYEREIRKFGANSLLLKVAEYQEAWDSSFIAPDPERTLAYQDLRFALLKAKKIGLRTVLMPIVLLRTPRVRTDWRGMIEPKNFNRWLNSYEGMILKYARLAQETGVEIFTIGSELVSMEGRVDFWNEIQAKVRSVYRGKLVYAFNWDHLSQIPSWKTLDYLGVNAYYELSNTDTIPSQEELRETWEPIIYDLERWQMVFDKPLLVMEVGYPSRKEGLRDPWDHVRQGSVDHRVQFFGFEAFLKSWESVANVEGVFVYEWHGGGGLKDISYSPKDKPVAILLKKWMQGG